jgi:phosphoribosylanthranilate isomerase
MKIKICGITRADDAAVAVECGADAVGFIFVHSSRRCITLEHAAAVASTLPSGIMKVGVFVNASRDEIASAIRTVGLSAVQLHGDETVADVLGYDLPVIKAHRVSAGFDLATLDAYAVHAHLFDAAVAGAHGGTGQKCDWTIAAHAALRTKVVLSGGLHPGNVVAAIAAVRPMAVDVSSGVELSPGVKDPAKIRAFVAAARRAFDQFPSS